MYVVLGATGNTGRVVVRELAKKGALVRAIVRSSKSAVEGASELVQANLEDEESLVRALSGARGVYAMLPPRSESSEVLRDWTQMADTLGRALTRAGTPHVVQLSSIGAHRDRDTGPILSNHYLEQVLARSVPAVTRIRAPYFMENWAESLAGLGAGQLFTMLPPDLSIPMIATEDIGVCAANALLEGPRGIHTVELIGPRDYSARDAASILSGLLGRDIQPAYVPPEAVVQTLVQFGMPEKTAALFRDMYQGVITGHIRHEAAGATQAQGAVELATVLRALLERSEHGRALLKKSA